MADTSELVLDEDGNAKPHVVPDDLLKVVASDFGIAARRIKSPRKGGRSVCLARDELCRRLYARGYSQGDIGRFLGDRHHSTVTKAVQRAEARLAA